MDEPVVPTPKRRTKGKRVVAMNKAPKTVWTLRPRWTSEVAMSAAQLSILLGIIALAINVLHGTAVPALAVQNKYSSLKRKYSAMQLARQASGKAAGVVYPVYGDEVVTALGNKVGLGHINYTYDISRH
ncbi:hypothetical protein AaE_014177 [Aphanomyces astaci]|uniref:Uncharacterized protein n=1 Tax=Aphanomyces astaci TaxID=112090 RepID=A0A6A4Z895_APHAT|nr:hypothetical protein AaE_014177 [Aphanomyces astaci]